MTCDEAEILLHALIDGELDAGHAREVEDHIAGCPRCAAQLRAYREMSKAIAGADLRYKAPLELRRRIEAALPQPTQAPSRRAVLRGFAMGSAVSAIAATGLVAIVLRSDDEAAHQVRGRLGASALVAGGTSHRRDFHRPAYGEAVVQRQTRRGAAGDRPHRAGLYPDRRPARLCRCPRHRRHRLPPARACDQSVRRPDRQHRAPRRQNRNAFRDSISGAGATGD